MREYHKHHRNKIINYSKKWRKENKEKVMKYADKVRTKKKEYHKNYNKGYHQRHREQINLKTKVWRQNNREKIKVYNLTNRERLRQKNRDYMAKQSKIIHDFSTKEWLDKLEKTRGICPKCNRFIGVENLTLDHIYPISKAKEGQVYTIDDVQPLCMNCNSSKGSKVLC